MRHLLRRAASYRLRPDVHRVVSANEESDRAAVGSPMNVASGSRGKRENLRGLASRKRNDCQLRGLILPGKIPASDPFPVGGHRRKKGVVVRQRDWRSAGTRKFHKNGMATLLASEDHPLAIR